MLQKFTSYSPRKRTAREVTKLWNKLIRMESSFAVLKYIYLEASIILISQLEVKE